MVNALNLLSIFYKILSFEKREHLFFFEQTPSFPIKKRVIRSWIHDTVFREGFQVSSLKFIFCSDEYLLRINQSFLEHDFYTDIITFDQSDVPNFLEGDIFISVDRVKSNSLSLNLPFETELLRIIIHGVLHLIGYGDKNPHDKVVMREMESFYVNAISQNY